MRARILLAAALAAVAARTAAAQSIDRAVAHEYFREAESAARALGSGVWSRELYGPMLFVNARTREAVANVADAAGTLQREGDVYVGRYPDSLHVFNGAVEWQGTRWTLLGWPLPAGRFERARLMTHELFHRIQPELGLAGSNPANSHLDNEDARVLLRLEWRALQHALGTKGGARTAAIADALAYRVRRHALYPEGARQERALELNEGLSEYTGVRAAIPEPARAGWVLRLIDNADARARNESLVRNFAYTSGAAYGLLLDAVTQSWRRGLTDDSDFAALIATAYKTRPAASPNDAQYGRDGVEREEAAREAERRERNVAFRKRFLDGPTLTLPVLSKFSYSFDPNAVVPFEEHGTVYLTTGVQDEWGALEVTRGGALFVREGGSITRVIVPLEPDGYTLKLADGWELAGGTVRRK